MDLLFRQDAYLKSCDATVVGVDEKGIRLDRTVFYPMGGGQPGDVGRLVLADGGVIEIMDAVKGVSHEDVVHVPKPGSPAVAQGASLRALVDFAVRRGYHEH